MKKRVIAQTGLNPKLKTSNKLIDKSDASDEMIYIDKWLESRKNTGNYNDQLGGVEKQRQMTNLYSVEEKSPINFYKDMYPKDSFDEDVRFEMAKSDMSDAIKMGVKAGYHKDTHSMFSFGLREEEDESLTKLHEYTHSLNAVKQEKKIVSKIKPKDEYLDDPSEIYSRLMQTRKKHNMNPKKNYSLDEVKKMKKSLFHVDDGLNLIERYSPKELHYLFNRVADNKVKPKLVRTPKYA